MNNSKTLRTAVAIGGALLLYNWVKGETVEPYIDDAPEVTVDPTITREQARIIAEQVSMAIYGSSTFWQSWLFGSMIEDEGAVMEALTNEAIRNDADVLLVADAYGVRSAMWTPDYTLPQALKAYLEPSDIATINQAYADRNINLRF